MVSASTNMAQIFTGGGRAAGGRSVFFFGENFLIRYANLYFQKQGTVTTLMSLPEERRCQSRPGGACTCVTQLDGWRMASRACVAGHVRATSSSPLSRASSAPATLDRFRR